MEREPEQVLLRSHAPYDELVCGLGLGSCPGRGLGVPPADSTTPPSAHVALDIAVHDGETGTAAQL